MSFGIFESATADDLQNEQRKKLAGTRLAQAAADVDSKLGPMLSKSTSVRDYHDRVRLAEKDFRAIVGKYLEGEAGFIAVAKKLEPHYTKRRSSNASRRVANIEWFEDWAQDGSGKVYTTIPDRNAPLSGPGAEVHQSEQLGPGWHWNVFSPENPYGESGVEATPENAMAAAERLLGGGVTASRRVANNDLEDLKEFVHSLGAKTRKRRGRDGFMFPAATGANGAISIRPNGEIVVETVFGGGAGGMQSVYSPNEIDLVKDWIEKTVGGSYRMSRRKKADPNWKETDPWGDAWDPSIEYSDEEKEMEWVEEKQEHPDNLYDIGDMLAEEDFLKAPIGTSVTVPTDDFDGYGNPGEFDLVKGPGGGWHNQDFKADLHWSEIGQAPVSNLPQNRRRQSSRRRRANSPGQQVDVEGLHQLPVGSVVTTVADDGFGTYDLEKIEDDKWLWTDVGEVVDTNYIGQATVKSLP